MEIDLAIVDIYLLNILGVHIEYNRKLQITVAQRHAKQPLGTLRVQVAHF